MERITEDTQKERTWAMFCHLERFCGIYYPLWRYHRAHIVWAIKRTSTHLWTTRARRLSISRYLMLIYYIISAAILILIACRYALLIALFFFRMIIVVVAAIKASEGVRFRYPLCIRFIS
jgi:uncharacterized protein